MRDFRIFRDVHSHYLCVLSTGFEGRKEKEKDKKRKKTKVVVEDFSPQSLDAILQVDADLKLESAFEIPSNPSLQNLAFKRHQEQNREEKKGTKRNQTES